MDGTPLDDAVRGRHKPVVDLLVTTRRAVLPPTDAYHDMFIQAAADNDISMVDMLLSAGLDPNCCGQDQRTALHLCVDHSAFDVARRLVELQDVQLGAALCFVPR
jgi:ankyrin repeat protein